tara:strand:- start:9125 stop:9790 length:666 start_codon:yes stop_codon:yes gene_type:complete
MKSVSTITALVAALAVTSGGLGLSLTGVFDENDALITSNSVNGLMMGHLTVEAHNEAGELVAYRQTDNEVVDDGEQCILKMLFATTDGVAGRGGYGDSSSPGACTGVLTGAWDVIAIGTDTTAASDTQVLLGNETSSSGGLERAMATTKTWSNGTGADATKIQLSKTFTNNSPNAHTIAESGLFNSTTNDANGMLARQQFTGVALSNGDSITITWTFTVGN